MTDGTIDPALLAMVREGLGGAVPFARHTGVTLDEVHDGRAVASLGGSDKVLNHVGTVHAGALFTLAETASGAAMAGALADVLFEIKPLVRDAAVTYRRPARAPLRATAVLDRDGAALRSDLASAGRVDFEVAVAVVDGRDREVATFRAAWVVKHDRAGQPDA